MMLYQSPPAVVARLTEWKVELSPAAVPAGTVTFTVTNGGSIPHAFEVEGHGVEQETPLIQPGATATLTLALRPGGYEVYCPVGNDSHKKLGMVATLHFAPTPRARQNLLHEGIASERIFVTGNPVVDALQAALPKLREGNIDGIPQEAFRDGRVILLTAHRRENHGSPLESICLAIRELLKLHPDVRCVYPVHLNPQVQQTVYRLLGGIERVHLIPPLDYWSFIQLLARSSLVLTDSGGVQEEAPSLGKPVLVLRKVTERPEAAEAGLAKVVGTDTQTIIAETSALLGDADLYARMAQRENPYGDGQAARRIVDAIRSYFAGITDR